MLWSSEQGVQWEVRAAGAGLVGHGEDSGVALKRDMSQRRAPSREEIGPDSPFLKNFIET